MQYPAWILLVNLSHVTTCDMSESGYVPFMDLNMKLCLLHVQVHWPFTDQNTKMEKLVETVSAQKLLVGCLAVYVHGHSNIGSWWLCARLLKDVTC